jgi:hypothetical protein
MKYSLLAKFDVDRKTSADVHSRRSSLPMCSKALPLLNLSLFSFSFNHFNYACQPHSQLLLTCLAIGIPAWAQLKSARTAVTVVDRQTGCWIEKRQSLH